MVKIVVLASFNMDLVMRAERRPEPGETLQGEFQMHLGGKGFNQAVAARRLGADVSVAGRVGDDEFGRRFLAALDENRIDRRSVTIDAEIGTGVATIVVEPDGGNAILQSPRANRRLAPDDIDPALFAGADAALLQLETSMPAANAFAQRARDAGALTVLNPAPAADVPAELLALTDVLVPNEIEACHLTGGQQREPEEMAELLLAQGPRTVVVTLGERGAFTRAAGISSHVRAFAVDAVDTVGAGDAFCAALAVALSEGTSIVDAVRFANAAGAVASTRHGAEPSMPRRDDVEAMLRGGI